MTGTFTQKTRVYLSDRFVSPLVSTKDFDETAVAFLEAISVAKKSLVLNPDYAVKAMQESGLGMAIGSNPADTDNSKRVNRGGTPGMTEPAVGYRMMPNEKMGPGKILRMFPSRESQMSVERTPNFGFIDAPEQLTPEQQIAKLMARPIPRMQKYRVNPKNGEPIEGSLLDMDPFAWGKTRSLPPEIEEKSLGTNTIGRMMRGSGLIARTAAKFGVVFDELGKMRCPPGTPAANQFTDMNASNCFGASAETLIGMAVDLAQKLVPDDERGGLGKKLANFIFDWDNSPLGRTTWYDENGNRIKNYRKWREAGNVSVGERWMVNGAKRALEELDAQDLRVSNLLDGLDIDRSDASKAVNNDLVEAFEKLRQTGVINAELGQRWSPDQVRSYVTSDLQRIPEWSSLSPDERSNLIKADIARYYEVERGNLEAFLDEVIKNPEHMKQIAYISFDPTSTDEGSFNVMGVTQTGELVSDISLNIPYQMKRQESLLPNLKPNERLKIYMQGGTTDADRARGLNDFLLNANAYATQMAGLVAGPRGSSRHTMKHEIAHSIQAAAIWKQAAETLRRDGKITLKSKKGAKELTSLSDFTSEDVLNMMQGFSSMDLDSMYGALSRSDTVQFLAGRYVYEPSTNKSHGLRMLEIGAELWANRSLGLIYGDDIDNALEYMDSAASSAITAERLTTDAELVRVITDSYFTGIPRMMQRRRDAMRASFIDDKEKEVAKVRNLAKAMTQDELIAGMADSIASSAEYTSRSLDPALASDDEVFVNTRSALAENKKVDVLAREWKKRFTSLTGTEADEELDLLIDNFMASSGNITPERLEERMRRESIKNRIEEARSMTLEDLAQKSYDYRMMSEQVGLGEDERNRLRQYSEVFKSEYLDRRGSGADSISREEARKEFQAIQKDIDRPRTEEARRIREEERAAKREEAKAIREAQREAERDARKLAREEEKERLKVERETEKAEKKRNTPKKIKTQKGAQTHAEREREASLESASAREREAFVEIGDPSNKDTGSLLDPESFISASKAIQARNKRLKKNGITPDSKNRNEASVEEQFENIIIPTLTLMDKSPISDTVDIETEITINSSDVVDVGYQFTTDGLITGTLMSDDKPHKLSRIKRGNSDDVKIIVRARSGDKALFPSWSSDHNRNPGTQRAVMPSGSIRVIEKRDDGTIVAEIVSQDTSEQILDRIVGQIAPKTDGESNYALKKGMHSKVSRVVDRHIAYERRKGNYKKPKVAESETSRIDSENSSLISDVLSSGGSWGEQISGDKPEFNEESSLLPSGIKPQTREERTDEMLSDMSDISSVMRLSSLGAESSDIDTDDEDLASIADIKIDPLVSDVISTSSDEEIHQIVSDSAMRLHSGFDSRPRVRVREDELSGIIETGSYVFGQEMPESPTDRAGKFDTGSSQRLSSGRMSNVAKSNIRRRISDRAADAIAKRTGIESEDAREIADIVSRTALALSVGPQAALASLAKELVRRGSRDIAEKVLKDLVEKGKITQNQADFTLGKISRIAPEGLPDPILRGATRGITEAREFISDVNTPENRERAAEIARTTGQATREGFSTMIDEVSQRRENLTRRGRDILARRRARSSIDEAGATATPELNPFSSPPTGPALEGPSLSSGARNENTRRLERRIRVAEQEPNRSERISSRIGQPERIISGRDDMRTSTPESSRNVERVSPRPLRSENEPTVQAEIIDRVNNPEVGQRNTTDRNPVSMEEQQSGVLSGIFMEDEIRRGKLSSGKPSARLSSGASSGVEKTLKRGSFDRNKTSQVKSKIIEDGKEADASWTADAYQIGDEKIVFGVGAGVDFKPDDGTNVKTVPISPFAISGLEIGSNEGNELAKNWAYAKTGYKPGSNDQEQKTYVDALLYAAVRGDDEAKEEFDKLAKAGKEAVEEAKKARYPEDPYDQLLYSWIENPEEKERDINRVAGIKQIAKENIKKEGLEDMTLDDLFIIHETTHDLPYDDDGDISLRPAGDYDQFWEDGTPFEANRGTLHFALNHVVKPVEGFHGRLSPKESQVIVVKLKDVLEANPGALDNLFAVDTFLTPEAGRGLKIPKDKAKIVKRDGESDIHRSVEEVIREMGGRHIFSGGETHSTPGVDARVWEIASELGVTSTIHANTRSYGLERRQTKNQRYGTGDNLQIEESLLSNISENALTRLAIREDLIRGTNIKYENVIDI